MSHGTSTEPVWQAPSLAYPEIEYVRWCRARAVSRGESPDSGLFVHIFRHDRGVFEAEWRERHRMARGPSDLEPLSDLLEVVG